MLGKLKHKAAVYIYALKDRRKTMAVLNSPAFKKERQFADIIRRVHSIEKGLCIENPRMGFGIAKLNSLFELCKSHASEFGNDDYCLKMARDAIGAYIEFHNERGYTSDDFKKICEAYADFPCKKDTEDETVYGGALDIKHSCRISIDELEKFFSDRHSIRCFTDEEVTETEITRAVRAAQYAPSACNRQGVRSYVLSSAKLCELYKKYYKNDLSGIGGFAENTDKFILITGKLSAYSSSEAYQHIVSASIFSTYLIEALFSMGIGSCMVQRPLYHSPQWDDVAKEIGIPEDERLVLMIAVGKVKDEYKVPVSKRLPTEQILSFIK